MKAGIGAAVEDAERPLGEIDEQLKDTRDLATVLATPLNFAATEAEAGLDLGSRSDLASAPEAEAGAGWGGDELADEEPRAPHQGVLDVVLGPLLVRPQLLHVPRALEYRLEERGRLVACGLIHGAPYKCPLGPGRSCASFSSKPTGPHPDRHHLLDQRVAPVPLHRIHVQDPPHALVEADVGPVVGRALHRRLEPPEALTRSRPRPATGGGRRAVRRSGQSCWSCGPVHRTALGAAGCASEQPLARVHVAHEALGIPARRVRARVVHADPVLQRLGRRYGQLALITRLHNTVTIRNHHRSHMRCLYILYLRHIHIKVISEHFVQPASGPLPALPDEPGLLGLAHVHRWPDQEHVGPA